MSKKPLSINEINPYTPEYIRLFEALYGKNLMSLGGLASVDALFDDINLRHLNALDVGFGLGGISYYLAEKFQMSISGIELYQWMVDHAIDHAPAHLKNQLRFKTYDSRGSIPYEPSSFDIAFSKGVLNHVKEKEPLFKQILEKLKPGGKLLIADWIIPGKNPILEGPIVSETKESYFESLKKADFIEISARNEKAKFQKYVSDFLINLKNKESFIKQTFGEALFLEIFNQHITLSKDIEAETKIPLRIVARRRCQI